MPITKKIKVTLGLILGAVLLTVFFVLAGMLTGREVTQHAAVRKNTWIVRLAHGRMAPYFTLTDQRGERIQLSQFRGKAIVLEFLDPHCKDICPLVAREIILAQHLLGPAAKQVVFLAVNVNPSYPKVSDVLAFSQEHGLNRLPNFHFLTGPPAELKAVWKAYHISVIPESGGEVQHSSSIYFITPAGHERYIGHPQDIPMSISDWARAIVYYVRQTF